MPGQGLGLPPAVRDETRFRRSSPLRPAGAGLPLLVVSERGLERLLKWSWLVLEKSRVSPGQRPFGACSVTCSCCAVMPDSGAFADKLMTNLMTTTHGRRGRSWAGRRRPEESLDGSGAGLSTVITIENEARQGFLAAVELLSYDGLPSVRRHEPSG